MNYKVHYSIIYFNNFTNAFKIDNLLKYLLSLFFKLKPHAVK